MVVAFSQKLEEQDRKALNTKEQLQREHRYLKRRLEQLSVSGSVERIRTDSMGSTISTDSEQGSLSVDVLHVTTYKPSHHLLIKKSSCIFLWHAENKFCMTEPFVYQSVSV